MGEPHLLEVVVLEEQAHQSAKKGKNLFQCNEVVHRLGEGWCHGKTQLHKLVPFSHFSSAPC